MKRILLSIVTISVIGANAQNVNIPDANFKAYLLGNTAINTNSDTEIQESEASAFTGTINCSSQSISDLTGIESFTALTVLNCYGNLLTTLDLTQNSALTQLHCFSNSLITLDVTQNTALTFLSGYGNLLNTLDVTQNSALTVLTCNGNSLSSLDLTQNTNLTDLYCHSNSITALDVTQNTDLIDLRCYNNSLTALDVTQNTALTLLSCYGNSIPDLNVTQNTALTGLYCNDNSLNTLDVSQNTALTEFYCNDNSLTSLNVANGNNSGISNPSFNATNNPNLACIQVDDVAYSTSNWTNIDGTTSFNTNCVSTVLVNSISVQGQGGSSTIAAQGGTLQMEATVLPTNADDGTYTWSATNGTGSATISPTGVLTASTDGTVTVTATANDGSAVTGSTIITISNQSVGIDEQTSNLNLSIYPNPAFSQITIQSNLKITSIVIVDLTGKTVGVPTTSNTNIDVSNLTAGIYYLQIQTDKSLISKKFIKK